MSCGKSTRFISAFVLLLIAVPSISRTFVECADGTQCPGVQAVEAKRDCCHPEPCHIPAEKTCVIKSVPAVDRVQPEIRPRVQPLLLLLIRTTVALLPPTPLSIGARRDTILELPPNQPAPKQGRAPRPPPTDLL